jgi:hypothetical protein
MQSPIKNRGLKWFRGHGQLPLMKPRSALAYLSAGYEIGSETFSLARFHRAISDVIFCLTADFHPVVRPDVRMRNSLRLARIFCQGTNVPQSRCRQVV